MGTFATGNSNDLITQLMQQRHGGTADATTGTRHDNLPILRANTGIFQRHHTQHGGKTGSTDNHCFTRVQPLRHGNQPVTFHSRLFRQPTPVVFTNAPASE
ncbi:Uncharacterised protein [Klebsiella variicola]|nr:Uncharacterised protein [Klebsiella variicola]